VPTADASSDATPLLSCRLQHSQVLAGEKTVLFVEVQEIADLYGYQFELYFAKEMVSLLEGDIERSGINFKLGDFLSPDFVVMNDVNGDSGRASLALTQMDPSKPRSGSGILARIELQALEPGKSLFAFNNVILATSSAEKIAHSLRGCALQILPSGQSTQPSSPMPTINKAQPTIQTDITAVPTDIQLTSTPSAGQMLNQSVGPTFTILAKTSFPSVSPTPKVTEPLLVENLEADSEGQGESSSNGIRVPLGFGLAALILVSFVFLVRKVR